MYQNSDRPAPFMGTAPSLSYRRRLTAALAVCAVLGASAASAFAQEPQTVRLETLDVSRITTGWGAIGLNRSVDGRPLSVGGEKFANGLGVHAPSKAWIALGGTAKRFQARVGVDDEVSGSAASIEFRVVGDGKLLWSSGMVRAGAAAKTVDVDVTGVTQLLLEVTDGGNGREYDHAVWGDARITYAGSAPQTARDPRQIVVEAGGSVIAFLKGDDGRLRQTQFGGYVTPEPNDDQDAYPAYGAASTLPSALRATHADGNTSTDLRLVGQSRTQLGNITTTRLDLKDPAYPFFVTLYFKAYAEEGIIEQWSEIRNQEKSAVTLYGFASAAPTLGGGDHYLTQFRGGWANEMNAVEEKLVNGAKTLSSRRGTQALITLSPSFLLSRGAPAQENRGEVLAATLAYPGDFQMLFDTAPNQQLRAICGINPEQSEYRLAPGETFVTPPLIWGRSDKGTGDISRRFARWGRKYGIRDGDRQRAVLLNNWEATFFNFDEARLVSLFDGGKELGMELFLLDDGWFGNKHPRETDNAGLGDWEVNHKKLPRGISYLTDEARKRGLRFGLWVEPEMVNPRSELYEKHPDWVIRQPQRELNFSRNQLVLDLSNPKVREWMYQTLHRVLGENPGITYIKWDCNRPITQPGSSYLAKDKQSHLWIEYQRGLLNVLDRLSKTHPGVEIMMCSSGGGRVDYGSLRYAHEVWPSDNTDPLARIRMQWSYGQFFPTNVLSSHVTHWGGRPLKFAFDVAMSARLGMDLDTTKLSEEDKVFAQDAVATYKSFRDVIQFGDLYRLESPYGNKRAAQVSVAPDKKRAVLFAWQIEDDATAGPVKVEGLSQEQKYRVVERNRKPGQAAQVAEEGKLIDSATLMRDGLTITLGKQFDSVIIELTTEAE